MKRKESKGGIAMITLGLILTVVGTGISLIASQVVKKEEDKRLDKKINEKIKEAMGK